MNAERSSVVTAAQSIGGGLGDASGVSKIWAGAIGTDIATGEDLKLAPGEQGAMLGEGVGTVATIAMGGRLYRAGRYIGVSSMRAWSSARLSFPFCGPPGTVTSNPSASGVKLVHMTTSAEAIKHSGKLGLPSDLYAGPASNAQATGWNLTIRTGLSPTHNYTPIWIPPGANSSFVKPIPVGPVTTWQFITGQQYGPRKIVHLATGEVSATGINRTQAIWYAVDLSIMSVGVASATTLAIDAMDK